MFLGIDPSYVGTGIVILDQEARLVGQVIMRTKPTHTWQDRVRRIQKLRKGFSNLPPCRFAAIEGYSYGSGYQSHQMGELGFAFREFLLGRFGDDRAFVIPPTSAKKFITGNGRAGKAEVAAHIEDQFGLSFSDLNLSDACSLALFILALKNPTKFTPSQVEAVLRWKDRASTTTISTKVK